MSYSGLRDRLDRETAPFLGDDHLLESLGRFERLERDDFRKALDETDVDHVPRRLVLRAVSVVVPVTFFQREGVGICRADDFCQARHA